MPSSRPSSATARPASARLSASMIWLSVKRDFFIVEILLWRPLLLKTLVLRGDYPPKRLGFAARGHAAEVLGHSLQLTLGDRGRTLLASLVLAQLLQLLQLLPVVTLSHDDTAAGLPA